jgi:hypothetical protein
VQQALRQLFAEWGLPQRLRVDNGAPWGPGADLPPPLALWCWGLGIAVVWNHPYRPTENGKVERAHGTLARWTEPERCPDLATWEQALAREATVQRELYPAIGGQSRLAAYPGLRQPLRSYEAAQEAARWELPRVCDPLAQGLWPRQVSTSRQISLYGQAYRVGKAQPGQRVWVRFDPATCEWVVQSGEGSEWARHPAAQITAERICHLEVAKPHVSGQRRPKRPNLVPDPAITLYAA